MNTFNLTDEQANTLKEYPNLNSYVQSFIKNNGVPEETGCISNLVYFFKKMCTKYNLDEEVLFDWDKETADDFYSWGSGSRWANTFASYLDCNFNKCIKIAIDLADEYGDLDLNLDKTDTEES